MKTKLHIVILPCLFAMLGTVSCLTAQSEESKKHSLDELQRQATDKERSRDTDSYEPRQTQKPAPNLTAVPSTPASLRSSADTAFALYLRTLRTVQKCYRSALSRDEAERCVEEVEKLSIDYWEKEAKYWKTLVDSYSQDRAKTEEVIKEHELEGGRLATERKAIEESVKLYQERVTATEVRISEIETDSSLEAAKKRDLLDELITQSRIMANQLDSSRRRLTVIDDAVALSGRIASDQMIYERRLREAESLYQTYYDSVRTSMMYEKNIIAGYRSEIRIIHGRPLNTPLPPPPGLPSKEAAALPRVVSGQTEDQVTTSLTDYEKCRQSGKSPSDCHSLLLKR